MSTAIQPVIKRFEEIQVVGLGTRFISASSPDTNNLTVIPKLWGDYLPRAGEIKARLSRFNIGVVVCLEERDQKAHPAEMLYVAGAQVAETSQIPPGMINLTVPAGNYAVFTHHGSVHEIGRTIGQIFGSWLPQSGLKLRSAPHLELYDERFKPAQAGSEFDLCIPVE